MRTQRSQTALLWLQNGMLPAPFGAVLSLCGLHELNLIACTSAHLPLVTFRPTACTLRCRTQRVRSDLKEHFFSYKMACCLSCLVQNQACTCCVNVCLRNVNGRLHACYKAKARTERTGRPRNVQGGRAMYKRAAAQCTRGRPRNVQGGTQGAHEHTKSEGTPRTRSGAETLSQRALKHG